MQKFNTGGAASGMLGQSSSLSPYAGPYVTDMLGKGMALSELPYQQYGGPLTAGQSDLQTQAFQGLANLAMPTTAQTTYDPMSFTGAGYAAPTAQQAADGEMGAYTPASENVLQQYMTPYLQGALQPQYDAALRQSEIQAQKLQSQYGKAGAYGGSRQGVAEAELQRGLLDRMAGITGRGYQDAFTQAQKQFNTEQQRQMDAAGQAQRYGIQALGAQRLGGAEQRAIEGQGIAADIAQFEQERDYPYKQVQYAQSLLQGLPISTQDYQYAEPSTLSNVMGELAVFRSSGTMGIFGRRIMANIDSQINDRMQMYAGNPQGLMQRYAQTQELVDLLALQKMKNDRAAATSAVQGAMQTPSNTVKGQLEQEAMQGSRNDVLRSMAPGIQQQGQRMAQMQNRAAMGLPGQAAPNMARMADGGIVGYQQGGGVKRFQTGAMVENDESRFGVTTDSGLTPDEAVAVDMQGPEAQQPKFGDELGA